MDKDASIYVEITPELKAQLTEVLAEIGLTPSIAMGIFARQVVNDGGFPFTPKTRQRDRPNQETLEAMSDINNEKKLIKYGTVEELLKDWEKLEKESNNN